MLFRVDVALVVAALMLSSPDVEAACSSEMWASPHKHLEAVKAGPQAGVSRTEQTAVELIADPVEAAAATSFSFLQVDDLDPLDARRFVGPIHDEIFKLIAVSLAFQGDTTGSISARSTGRDWALDGVEDR